MFDLITVAQMFIYSARYFFSVVACSCVRTSRVLFVLPMYEELHEYSDQNGSDDDRIFLP